MWTNSNTNRFRGAPRIPVVVATEQKREEAIQVPILVVGLE